MGTLMVNNAACSRGIGRLTRPTGLHSGDYDDSHSPLCVVCAAIFCFALAMTIVFSLKQEVSLNIKIVIVHFIYLKLSLIQAVWAKVIVMFILVLSIIVICAACLQNEKKSLPVQSSRIEFGTEKVVKKEHKTVPVQHSRIGFIKANVLAFFKKLKTFLFLNKTKPSNSHCLESELTKSSLPVASLDNIILV